MEVTSCGTQTEAPAGELLQEVQRLQELRARIQERAVKVPVSPVTDTKTCSSPEVTEAVDIAQLAAYQERIHDLEERLSTYEESEEKFLQERHLSKQRDEELLDENYKLTEKIYWLENEIRNMRDISKMISVETMTEMKVGVDFSSQCNDELETIRVKHSDDNLQKSSNFESCVEFAKSLAGKDFSSSKFDESCKFDESSEIAGSSKECCLECCNLLKNFETRIEHLAQTEYILRQQITVLERRERAFIETLKQADTTWSSVEMDYKRKYEEMQERLKAQTQLNRVFLEHLTALNKVSPGVRSTETEYIEKLVDRLSGALDSMDVIDGIEKMIVDDDQSKIIIDDKTDATKTDEIFPTDQGLPCQTPSSDKIGSNVFMSSSKSTVRVSFF